jgi:hypothetical protein
MTRTAILLISITGVMTSYAQNVGIGTTTPRFPMSFPASNGQKISVYDDGNPAGLNFGIGMFSHQTMQIHSATSGDDIAFGYGSATNFMERMRIKGNGNVGINNNNPSEKLDVNGNLNITGTIKANGVDGTPNQVLMKNSGGSLAWGDIGDYKNFKGFTNTTPVVWTVPANVTRVIVEAWGAGGGGSKSGGGAGGGYIIAQLDVVAGNTLTINCGVGGAPGTTGNGGNGTAGGNTTVDLSAAATTQLVAFGGFGATNFQPGQGRPALSTNGNMQHIVYNGENGAATTETYSQFLAGVFFTTVTYGNGGNAPFAPNTGAKGGMYVYNSTNINTVNRQFFAGNGLMPGGGGTGYSETNTYGTFGGNGMVIVRW